MSLYTLVRMKVERLKKKSEGSSQILYWVSKGRKLEKISLEKESFAEVNVF